MIRRVNTKERRFAKVNGTGVSTAPPRDLIKKNGGGSSGSSSTSSNGSGSSSGNSPTPERASLSDWDKRKKQREEMGLGSEDKLKTTTANGSDSGGFQAFNIAGFNGYLLLVLVGMVIVAMRYK